MLDLGSIQFSLGIDTRGLDAAVARLNSFGAAVTKVQAAANSGIDTNIQALRKQENALLSGLERVKTAVDRINGSTIAPRMKTELIAAVNSEYDSLVTRLAKVKNLVDSTQYDRAMASFKSELNEVDRLFKAIAADQQAMTRANNYQAQITNLGRMQQALKEIENSSITGKSAKSSASAFQGIFDAEAQQNVLATAKAIEQANTAQAKFTQFMAGQVPLANKNARDSMAVFVNAEKAATTAEKAFLREQNAVARVTEQVRNLNAAIERSKGIGDVTKTKLTTSADNALSAFKGNVAGAGGDPKAFSAAMNQARASLGDVNREFQKLTAGKDIMRELGTVALLINGPLGGISTRIIALNQIINDYGVMVGLATGATIGLGMAVASVSSKIINTTIEVQKAQKALTAITQSSAAAGTEIDFVRQVANNSGQVFTSLTSSYSSYLAAAKASGQILSETHQQFAAVSQAAGVLGLSVADTQGVFKALEQMLSKGTVQSEELRGQLGDRLPGAFTIAAQAMGKTTSELSSMLKKGNVITSDFLPKFVKQLQLVYGIDTSKPVTGLVADQNRLTNAMDVFFLAVDKVSGVTALYAASLRAVTGVITTVTQNMAALTQVVGALIGAMVGLGVAMALPAAFAAMAAMATWVGTVLSLARTVTTLTEAVTLFNVALAATPIGWISLILRVAAVAAGAAGGMWLMKQAQEGLGNSLNDTKGIEEYIKGQKLALTATEDTTNAMLRQIQVMQANAASTYIKAMRDVNSVGSGPSISDYGNAGVYGTPKALGGTGVVFKSATDIYTARKQEAQKAFGDATAELERLRGLETSLNNIASKQHGMKNQNLAGTQPQKQKKVSENIHEVLNLIGDANKAAEQLNMLAQGPKDLKIVDDLFKAKEILRDMNEVQLGKTAAALGVLGPATKENLLGPLQAVITKAREGKEQVEAFIRVWEKIDRANIERANTTRQLNFLNQGGDARQLGVFSALGDAEDMLRKVKDPKALEAIRQRLAEIGFNGNTAAAALALMFHAMDQGEEQIKILTDLQNAVRQVQVATAAASATLKGYSISAEVGDAVQRFVEINQKVQEYNDKLILAGKSTQEAAAATKDYRDALLSQDKVAQQLEKTKQRAEALRDVWKSFGTDATQTIIDLATGVKNLGDAITDLFMGLVKNLAANELNNLFSDAIDSLTGKGKKADAQGAQIANTAALATTTAMLGANTTAIIALTTAVAANTSAMTAISSVGGGSGGGGLLGTIFDGVASLFGGASPSDTGLSSIDLGGFGGGGGLFGFGRAGGGPVTKGLGYTVNEPGVGHEIFFPNSSGQIIPASQLGGGGQTSIDARTSIVIQGGANEDTVALLDQKLDAHRRKIEASLGPRIDARVKESAWRNR